MKTSLSWILGAAVGASLAAGLIISCSDDSPRRADAATCDCPAAEPPLAGRIVEVGGPVNIVAGRFSSSLAACPTGGILLSGGCTVEAAAGIGIISLRSSGPRPNGYVCEWASSSSLDALGKIAAICLLPAN